jgi:G3E family GTPase
LNKIDLVQSEEELNYIEQRIKRLNPIANIIRSKLNQEPIDLNVIMNVGAFEANKVLKDGHLNAIGKYDESEHGQDHHDHDHDHHLVKKKEDSRSENFIRIFQIHWGLGCLESGTLDVKVYCSFWKKIISIQRDIIN